MNILIAEDDPVSRMLLRSILRADPEWSVTEAVNGGAAWNLLDQGLRVDLCIFDIMMPELNGLDVIRRIRADDRFRGMKVMLCSTMNDRNTITQAAGLGVNYYLLKPITRATVVEQVRKIQTQVAAETGRQSPSAVCNRLGIPRNVYEELLGTLSVQVTECVEGMPLCLEEGRLSPASMKVSALRSAALNLGATGIVDRVTAVESILTRDNAHEIDNQTDPAERERRFTAWSEAHRTALNEALERLAQEGRKLPPPASAPASGEKEAEAAPEAASVAA